MGSLGFWAVSRAEPSRTAVIEDDGTRHLACDVLARVNQQTHALRLHGLQVGGTVAVCLENRLELIELYMAVVQSGAHFLPVPSGAAAPEIAYMLNDSEATVFLFGGGVADAALAGVARMTGPRPACFSIGEVAGAQCWRDAWTSCPTSAPVAPTAGGTLIYTSGTTGAPRAVKRPLSGLSLEDIGRFSAAHLNAVARIRPQSGAVHLVSSPLYHSASLLWCVDHLHVGHAVSLMSKWSAEKMIERIERDRATGSLMVPTHFHRLLSLPAAVRERYDVSSLRHVVHTGAQCPVTIKKRMLDWWGPVIYEVYGATEGGGTCVGPDEWLRRPGTVGRGFGRIQVLRNDGSHCAAGEVGTVFIRHAAQRFEYHRDAAKTAAGSRGDYFTVGDLGYLDQDGYLFLCGRSADVVICGGVNIYPAQVEDVLATHPAVRDVAVFGVPDDEWGEQVQAVVELEPGWCAEQKVIDELQLHCRTQLASLKCPRRIHFAESLPRGENGKLYKEPLRDCYARETDAVVE
jgi:long-chain acyl-CoA synthetase